MKQTPEIQERDTGDFDIEESTCRRQFYSVDIRRGNPPFGKMLETKKIFCINTPSIITPSLLLSDR